MAVHPLLFRSLMLVLLMLGGGGLQAQTSPPAAGPPAAPAPAASAAASAPAASASVSASASAPESADAAPASVRFAPVVAVEPPPVVRVNPRWLDDALPATGAWRYSGALDTLGAGGQADALRRVLLRRHLAQLAPLPGDPPPPALTVRQAIAEGEALRPSDSDGDLRSRWSALVNQQLRATLAKAALPIPPELEADAARLREAAPGLWSLHAADGTLRGRVWWLLLRHQAALPLPLAEFRVRAPVGALQMVFDCALPRYAELALAEPGRDRAYLCRANAGSGTPAAWDLLALALRSGTSLPLQIEPTDLSSPAAVQRLAMRLEGPEQAATQALVAAAAGGSASAPSGGSAGAAAPAAAAVASAASAPGAAARGWADRLRLGGLALAALLVFSLIAAMAGLRAALLISCLLLTGLTLMAMFKGLPALAGWLPRVDAGGAAALSPLRLLAALGLPLAATLVLALAHELLFGERLGLLRGLVGRVADWLSDGVVDRILHRGRY